MEQTDRQTDGQIAASLNVSHTVATGITNISDTTKHISFKQNAVVESQL